MDGVSTHIARDLTDALTSQGEIPSLKQKLSGGIRKISYAIPCATTFRDSIQELADKQDVNAGDLARSVLLTIPLETIVTAIDPGEPNEEDRESIILKSGPNAGKVWRRKPRLQVRLPAGSNIMTIRKALGLALALDRGENRLQIENSTAPRSEDIIAELQDKISRLQATIDVLAFTPLDHGITNQTEALYILGFPGNSKPGLSEIKTRFRMLAAIHHPDSAIGDTHRMSQLNQAMTLLRQQHQ